MPARSTFNALYYHAAAGQQYSDQPRGRLNYERLIRGQKPWLNPSPARTDEKKTLIINDFRDYSCQSTYYISKLSQTLNTLLENGFIIYLYLNDDFLLMTPYNLNLLEAECEHPLVHPDIIIEQAISKLKLTKDELLVLDDYWINYILQDEDELKERVLYTSDLYGKKSKEQLLDFFQKSTPPLRLIKHNLLTQAGKEVLHFLQKQPITPLKIVNAITEVTFKRNEATTFMTNGSITLYDATITLSEASMIKHINLHNISDIPVSLFEHTPELCTLIIKNSTIEACALRPNSLPKLKELHLANSTLSFDTLRKITASSELKVIIFEDYEEDIFHDFLRLDPKVLAQLERVEFYNISISPTILETLLNATPKLKTLIINMCSKRLYLTSSLKNLPNLTAITLICTEADHTDVSELLKKAPNINFLDLSQNTALDEDLMIEPLSLPELKILTLTDLNMSANNLSKILHAATNIVTLDLSEAKESTEDFSEELDLPSLHNLQRIKANNSLLNDTVFKQLLEKSHHITHLEVFNYEHLSDVFSDLEQNQLIDLKVININETDNEEIPEVLLRVAPNATLNVITCRIEHEDTELTDSQESRFNAQAFKGLTPTNTDTITTFKSLQTTDQKMIIDRLSQYLKITQQHLDMIPGLQDGICETLSLYYITHQETFETFVQQALNWDGRINVLPTCLAQTFDWLIKTHKTVQLSSSWYLGDALEFYLGLHTEPFILTNPWHAIAIVPPTKMKPTWALYDPNFKSGPLLLDFKELKQTILKFSLGNLISVSSITTTDQHSIVNALIMDPAQFLETGGLLSLVYCHNLKDEINSFMKQLFPLSALNGLLLRTTEGIPAWALALSYPHTCKLSINLLKLFIKENETWMDALLQSLDALPTTERVKHLQQLLKSLPALNTLSTHIAVEKEKALVQELEPAFRTWEKKSTLSLSKEEYCHEILHHQSIKKRLITTTDKNTIIALRWTLQTYARDNQRPFFYVHSPADLVCFAPLIVPNLDGTGSVKPGPGGPLHDFLTHNRRTRPVLVVNYLNFEADDFVRFNALLDKKPSADRTPLPEHTLIIGLMNHDCYQGADFHSRFDQVDTCPIPLSELQESIPHYEKLFQEDEPSILIQLFQSSDWKERLKGTWCLNRDSLFYQQGLLEQVITPSLEIQGGLWDDPEFQRFWQEYAFEHPDLKIRVTNDYDWDCLNQYWALAPQPPQDPFHVLTPYSLSQFFFRYEVDHHYLIQKPGILDSVESEAHRNISVYITQTPNLNDWAMLLTACQTHNTILYVYPCPGVTLPGLEENIAPMQISTPWSGEITSPTTLIESPDLNTTLRTITQGASWLTFDISECQGTDLLTSIQPEVIAGTLRFNERQSDLLTALQERKNIVLKGVFSQELVNDLAPFLLSRLNDQHALGQLVLLSSTLSHFNYAPVHEHAREHLSTDTHLWFNKKSSLNLGAFNIKTSFEQTQLFIQTRVETINQVLSVGPCVFLSGLSGVGKTTFIFNHFVTESDELFVSESNIVAWATKPIKARNILFLDEANLSPRSWLMFEGLFNHEPSLFIEGKHYPLSPAHKVIFAGNPTHYGSGRSLAPFFEQHNFEVIFDPMPLCAVYEQTLKPIFTEAFQSLEGFDLIIEHLLGVYSFICDISTTDVLITPRQLQMMALLIENHHRNAPQDELLHVAQYYVYQIAHPLIPTSHQDDFVQRFKVERPSPAELPTFSSGNSCTFVITESRKPIAEYLSDILHLREYRQKYRGNMAQSFGGLGGIILEGSPGIGKSELIIAMLQSYGYREAHYPKTPMSDRYFYYLSASLSLEDKEDLLLRAFHDGAIVIADEINSSRMLESLLNHLLMGKTPTGERPKRPGFTLIGTQNPTTMNGRFAQSRAFSNRLMTFILPEYHIDELVELLKHHHVADDKCQALAQAFLNAQQFANTHHLEPKPTLRKLLKTAEQFIQNKLEASFDVESDTPPRKVNKNEQQLSLPDVQQAFFTPSSLSAKTFDESYHSNLNAP